MKCFPSIGLLFTSLLLACFAGTVHAQEGGLEGTTVAAIWGNEKQAAPFMEAVTAAGGRGVPFKKETLLDGAGILVYSTTMLTQPTAPQVAEMEALLKRGGSVIMFISGRRWGQLLPAEKWKELAAPESLLPVNLWSQQDSRLARLSTGALAPADSPFAAVLKTPGFALPERYDLHLPYSTLEAGQHRYEWERLGKPLLNNDWKVLLTTDQDGKLPLLVSGRYFAGRVFMFGGDLYASDLQAWSGYGAFVRELLALARPCRVPAAAADVDQLRLSVAPVQPGKGALRLNVTNSASHPVQAVVLVKVRNAMRSLMNSVAIEVEVPAGKVLSLSIPEAAPDANGGDIAREGDQAQAFRWVDAGVSSLARQEVVNRISTLVDRTPPLAVSIEGEDVRKFEPTDSWPAGGFEMTQGNGVQLDRYVYFGGQKPKVIVHLRNALHNIAPLAQASDVNWLENPSAQGLNDGAFSYSYLRGKFNLMGFWSGKSAETQRLKLEWPMPVSVAEQRLVVQSHYRFWDRANPQNYTVTGAVEKGSSVALATVENAVYENCRRVDAFAPQVLKRCDLEITGLDPQGTYELKAFRDAFPDATSNCSVGEWEVYGWPGSVLPQAATGELTVTIHDLAEDKETVVVKKKVTVEPLKDLATEIEVPTRADFGQVRITAEFRPDKGEAVAANFPILFVPPGRNHLIHQDSLGEYRPGLLCSRGFAGVAPFGIGTNDDSQGWGGPDDKAWAWSLDLMEMGPRFGDNALRFFESPAGMSHYTGPWRDFPSGRYVWNWVTERLLDRLQNGDLKGKKSIHMILSDRWNGIPIGAAFTWADFIRFDEWLRAQGKPGLQSKTRREIGKEIVTRYGDLFQRYCLTKYSDELLDSQRRLAEAGVKFTVETHGSFPLAGGELGARLAKTHVGVGTDLFWELRDEDVFKAIGYRFGVVAANPDFESGAYNQWGWVSGVLANPTWFSTSGESEPSRRMWYAYAWAGRLTTQGEHKPYMMYGFASQGGSGVKNTMDDWVKFNRVQSTAIWLRPERPAGFGIVASWQLQENRMSPQADKLVFGLCAGKGYDQVNESVGELYQRLVKNGVPVSFVASTYALKQWKGKQPLVVTEGFETDPWEIAELDRLNRGGAPIIAVGSEHRAGRAAAEAFFGVTWTEQGWNAKHGTRVVNDASGAPFAFVSKRGKRPPVVFCPLKIQSIGGEQSKLLASLCQEAGGGPLSLSSGVSSNAFVSNGSLFLNLGSQSDAAQVIDVAVRPGLFDSKLTGTKFRVVDIDRAVIVPGRWEGNALHFQIPCRANDGRMIQILPVPAASHPL